MSSLRESTNKRADSSVRSLISYELIGLGLMVVYCIIAVNGLTFILISLLLDFFTYLNEGTMTIAFPVEVMAYAAVIVLMTAFCFQYIAFWIKCLFLPKLFTARISKFPSFINPIGYVQDKLELYQRESNEQNVIQQQ